MGCVCVSRARARACGLNMYTVDILFCFYFWIRSLAWSLFLFQSSSCTTTPPTPPPPPKHPHPPATAHTPLLQHPSPPTHCVQTIAATSLTENLLSSILFCSTCCLSILTLSALSQKRWGEEGEGIYLCWEPQSKPRFPAPS